MQLYNTLTRSKDPFEPQHDPITMYVCGITPYDDAHLGHAMSIIIFDTLRRFLEWRGRRVRLVYNFTDVDDKLIARAAELEMSVAELAERQIASFMDEWRELQIQPADVHPRATEEIPQMIELIGGLIEREMAYPAGGDVYFRVRRMNGYGKLSGRALDDMIAAEPTDIGVEKEHPMDFTLWKGAKPGEPQWESPWGPGRPGWHIECSAMSIRYLGEQIDLHGGGMDLIFPHHENEIAQSEAYSGAEPFVRHWVHNAMMQVGGEKMSKSTGKIVRLREGLDRFGADGLRMFVLGGHYRSPLTYSEESLAASARGAERLRLAATLPLPDGAGELDPAPLREQFVKVLEDDLNTPQALAVLFELARAINRARAAGEPAGAARDALIELGGVLGLQFAESGGGSADAAPFVDLLVEVRSALRTARQFELADQVRDRLADLGITLEDSREGTRWRRAEPLLEASEEASPEEESLVESALRF